MTHLLLYDAIPERTVNYATNFPIGLVVSFDSTSAVVTTPEKSTSVRFLHCLILVTSCESIDSVSIGDKNYCSILQSGLI